MALPTANSVAPDRVPVMDTMNSGKEVAVLTMVAPTMTGGTFVILAMSTELSVNRSPPFVMASIPIAIISSRPKVPVAASDPTTS